MPARNREGTALSEAISLRLDGLGPHSNKFAGYALEVFGLSVDRVKALVAREWGGVEGFLRGLVEETRGGLAPVSKREKEAISRGQST